MPPSNQTPSTNHTPSRAPADLEALVAKRTRYLHIAQRTADIANESTSIGAGLLATLECMCQELGWPVGHVYLQSRVNPDRYVETGFWWLDDEVRYESFVQASREATFTSGDGAIGMAIKTRTARNIGDDLNAALPHRAQAARDCGLQYGFVLPILIKDRVCGVMEFFALSQDPADDGLIHVVGQIGTQIGRLIERKELERDLIRTTHKEHRRIGEALHDTISQQITGIGMLARSLERKLEDENHPQAPRAHAILESVREASAQVRALSRGLNPGQVAPAELDQAIMLLANRTKRDFDIECTYTANAPINPNDEFEATEILRITSEAVHNAVKHANANRIDIEVRADPVQFAILVIDDGDGFDPDDSQNQGVGLRTIRHRADLIDAQLSIHSRPGEGTAVRCIINRIR